MDQEEDEYSDRDASGEEDTDFVDVNLSSRVHGVALDPALNEQGGYSYHDGRQEMPYVYENGYSQASGYVRADDMATVSSTSPAHASSFSCCRSMLPQEGTAKDQHIPSRRTITILWEVTQTKPHMGTTLAGRISMTARFRTLTWTTMCTSQCLGRATPYTYNHQVPLMFLIMTRSMALSLCSPYCFLPRSPYRLCPKQVRLQVPMGQYTSREPVGLLRHHPREYIRMEDDRRRRSRRACRAPSSRPRVQSVTGSC